MKVHRKPASSSAPLVRCAIYTRKSTEEGLQQEFNSLDAQRQSGEDYIRSQKNEGWECLAHRYDDGGFSGGSMDRPALKHMLADIEAGKIDTVIVYKVDRLSRSLLDFARILEAFDKHNVAFVSVTQQINSATSMGRLMLNVLLSFAQFERELVSERTRDKIAATRRKGKWCGGHPILGYDIDPQRFKLLVNEDEAARVRAIFALYIELGGLLAVVQELERRGWFNKRWTTRKGRERGGKPFTKTSLHKLLTNVAYLGKVKYKAELHAGEHAAIIDADVWQRVQSLLQRNGRSGGAGVRNQFGALLKGLLRCVPCGCAMTPAHTTKKGRRYRYYACTGAQKRGWASCPSKSIPAGEIEQFVLDQIRCIGRDRTLLQETLTAATAQDRQQGKELDVEVRALERDVGRWHADIRQIVDQGAAANDAALARLADLHERVRHAERRLQEIGEQRSALSDCLAEDEIEHALAEFDTLWNAMSPREQARIVHLLVEQVNYDGAKGKVSITFHPAGIQTLADELLQQHTKEKCA